MMETAELKDLRFDKNGLIPAVVQEACSGKVLMVAWMNAESLQKTLASGETWFYSRSRQELWHKGATSGHIQKVLDILVDCDADTLLVVVGQTGAACHTGSKSCFFRRLQGWDGSYNGSPAVLADLCEEIRDKKLHPTEKSYTAYLLQTGIDKICKKIGEESAEVIVAAKNVDAAAANVNNAPAELKREVCNESADLLYHLAVLWEASGVTLNDVMQVLEERSHVKGNKKTVGHLDKTF